MSPGEDTRECHLERTVGGVPYGGHGAAGAAPPRGAARGEERHPRQFFFQIMLQCRMAFPEEPLRVRLACLALGLLLGSGVSLVSHTFTKEVVRETCSKAVRTTPCDVVPEIVDAVMDEALGSPRLLCEDNDADARTTD